MKRLFYFTLFSLTMPFFLNASIVDTMVIDEIQILETRPAKSILTNVSSQLLNIASANQLQQSKNVFDIINHEVPGIFISSRGISGYGIAQGSSGQIQIRGIGGTPNTGIQVLLNGNPQYMGIMGHPMPDVYNGSYINEIEIIRGSSSIIYGSGAMGGVLNMKTRETTEEGFKSTINTVFGSFNTFNNSISGNFKKNKFGLSTIYSRESSDGFRDSASFVNSSIYVQSSYKLNQKYSIKSSSQQSFFEGWDPGFESKNAGLFADVIRGNHSLQFLNKTDLLNGSVSLFYNYGNHKISDGFLSTDFARGITLIEHIDITKSTTLFYGLDIKDYGGKAENTKISKDFGDYSSTEIGNYLLLKQSIYKWLNLDAGYRVENNSRYGWIDVGHVSAKFNLPKGFGIKSSFSEGYRNPTIRELLLLLPPALPNSELKPENTENAEIGITKEWNTGYIEATAFKIYGKNFISMGLNESKKLQWLNNTKVLNKGIELLANQSIKKIITISSNYSYIEKKYKVISVPVHQWKNSAKINLKKWSVETEFERIIDLSLQIKPKHIKESYTLINIFTAYQCTNEISVYIKLNNLLDKKYYNLFEYPLPGAHIMGGITFKIQ